MNRASHIPFLNVIPSKQDTTRRSVAFDSAIQLLGNRMQCKCVLHTIRVDQIQSNDIRLT